MGLLSPAFLWGVPGDVLADDSARHPVIGDKPARELLNADLLALPKTERQAWIHGAAAQMVQVLAPRDPALARCASDFFVTFQTGQEETAKVMVVYPDKQATVTLMAVTATACEVMPGQD